MMLHVCFDVAARVLKLPFIGTNETVAAYYMVIVVFLPMAYIAVIGANVTVDIFISFLRNSSQRTASLFASFVGLSVSTSWLWLSIREALHSTRIFERWVIGSDFLQVWPGKWVLVFAVAFLCLSFLLRVFDDFVTLIDWSKRSPVDREGSR